MSRTHRPGEFTNYDLDAAPIEIPPGGVSLKACSFRNLEMGALRFPFFSREGAVLIPATSLASGSGPATLAEVRAQGFLKRSTATVALIGAF